MFKLSNYRRHKDNRYISFASQFYSKPLLVDTQTPRQIYRTVIFLLFNQMYQTVIILYCDLFLVRSFLGLIPELLRIDGVNYVLTDRFNQDPLEEHFGKQRTRGGGVDNPTILQYMYNERKIIVSKSDMIIKGNTRGRKRDAVVIDTTDQKELPKRSKQQKDKI